MAQTLKFGSGTWATKKGSTLAYSDTNNSFKPLPFTYSGPGKGTRVNKQGLIEVVENDRPRIDYLDSEDGVFLLEKAATNLVTHSEDFSNASWTKLGNASGSVPILTSNYALSPDGTQNATRLQCDLNGGVTTSDQSIIYDIDSSNTSQTISIYLKSNNGQNQEVYLANTFGANDTVLITSKWKRYVFTHTSSNHTFSLGTRGSTGSSDVLDILIWGAQSESGNLSSYIPTQGTIQTRVQETASGSGNSEVFNSEQGVLFANIAANANDGSDREITLSDGTNTNRVVIGYNTSNQIVVAVISGSVQMLNTVTTDILLNKKIVLKYKQNDFALWIDGVKVYTDLIGSTFSENTLNQISFNRPDTNASVYGKIKELAYYNEVLTDLELETLTSYRTWESMVKELNLNIIHNE